MQIGWKPEVVKLSRNYIWVDKKLLSWIELQISVLITRVWVTIYRTSEEFASSQGQMFTHFTRMIHKVCHLYWLLVLAEYSPNTTWCTWHLDILYDYKYCLAYDFYVPWTSVAWIWQQRLNWISGGGISHIGHWVYLQPFLKVNSATGEFLWRTWITAKLTGINFTKTKQCTRYFGLLHCTWNTPQLLILYQTSDSQR